MAETQAQIPSIQLNDGTSIPILGYGTGTVWYKNSADGGVDRTTVEAIKTAIRLGYHHLDGAEVYKTEPELGTAIKESGVSREKLFVTTKVITNIKEIPNAITASLEKLQLDYVDLYLIHAPFFARSDADLQEAWAEMEKVKRSGKARSIGVSNYLQSHLTATLATATIPPSINQIEYHPYLQHGDLIPFHRNHDIATAAYGPLIPVTKAKPGPCDAILEDLARKYNVSEGEIALRWCIEQGMVTITTSGKEERLSNYLRALAIELTPEEMGDLARAGATKHFRGFWQKKFAADDRS